MTPAFGTTSMLEFWSTVFERHPFVSNTSAFSVYFSPLVSTGKLYGWKMCGTRALKSYYCVIDSLTVWLL